MKALVRGALTGVAESLAGVLAEELCEARALGVDSLLHGLHAHAQVAVLCLQHRILMHHVIHTLHTVLSYHALTLHTQIHVTHTNTSQT